MSEQRDLVACRNCLFPIFWDDGSNFVWPGWLHLRGNRVFCSWLESTWAEPVE